MVFTPLFKVDVTSTLKGGFQSALVLDVLLAVGLQGLIILLDRLVGRLDERGSGH